MNPQYGPPQSFGAPPPQQGYPQNRASPSSAGPPPLPGGPQGFQNVPLGPPPTKPGQPPPQQPHSNMNNAPQNMGPPSGPPAGQFPPQSLDQFPPSNMPPGPPRLQIPHSQLPPAQAAPMLKSPINNGHNLIQPQSVNGPLPQQAQNGPPQFQNGPNQNGPPFGANPPQPHSQFGANQPPRQGQPPNYALPQSIPGSFTPGPGQPLSNTQPPMMPRPGPGYNNGPPGPNQFAPCPVGEGRAPPSQLPGPPQNQLPGQPPFPPSQLPRQPQNQLPGQPPFSPSQLPGQPPFPPSQLPGQPPFPQSQYPQGAGQLPGQMQGMNLGGPRQYPGGPVVKNAMNGDGGPHMPPPLAHMNGQQMRAPAGGPAGYPPLPGQPPAPGAPPGHGHHGNYPQPAYQAPQQASKLDPNQMPSPIQVCEDDQKNRSGIFCTNARGLVPPLVNTNFEVQDQGNASPRFIRSTMYSVPISQDIMKQTSVPFSLVISPMARTTEKEYPPPIVDFGALGPVRCVRCKAYMCPYMQFIDSGRRFQCLFCKATTDVPQEYFQHLDHTGQRLDRHERPELVLGTYEMVATTDYCRNNALPKPPAFIFVIDVSYNNIKSGLVHLLCSQMKDIIENLPVDQGQERSNMRVGFITYNSSVHFYNVKGTLAAPQMLVVGDTHEMFMPLLDGFLCTPEESGPVIDSLMQQIPAMFGETRETETILLPAILAGLEALKASDCTGKLLVFHSTLPTAEAPGKLKNRDDRKLLGTDKEKTVLVPQTQAYNQLGQDCVAAGCSVDLFIFNNAYIDLATIGQVARLTGGEIYKYTYFQADIDGHRLINDIITDISKPIAFDSIMRVRTSTGIRPTDFYGHFYMSNTTDMELASIDCDKAVGIEIKHDDKLSEEEGVYIQAALLYTSCSGQRRLRVINLSLKTCSQMADLYRSCDCDTIINYLAKQATYKLLDNSPKAVKDSLVTRTAQILAAYRKNCATPSSAGQLILPECMKLLPLYVNCMIKSDALSGGSDMTVDDRTYVMQCVMIMDIPTSVNYFYPRLVPLGNLDTSRDPVEIPAPIRCTVDKLNDQDIFILENGIHLFMWVGMRVGADLLEQLFGGGAAAQNIHELPELDNPFSIAVRTVIDKIREQRYRCMKFTLVRQGDKLETVFRHFLAEDRGNDGSPSYVDFLIHMHKEIRSLLS